MKISRKQAKKFNLYVCRKIYGFEVANYYIEQANSQQVKYTLKMKFPLYAVLFIPVHILSFFVCMWDGGLKEFCICDSEIWHEYINMWGDGSRYKELVKLIDDND